MLTSQQEKNLEAYISRLFDDAQDYDNIQEIKNQIAYDFLNAPKQKLDFIDKFQSYLLDQSRTLEERVLSGLHRYLPQMRLHEAENLFRKYWNIVTDEPFPLLSNTLRDLRSELGILRYKHLVWLCRERKEWEVDFGCKYIDPLNVEHIDNPEYLHSEIKKTRKIVTSFGEELELSKPKKKIIGVIEDWNNIPANLAELLLEVPKSSVSDVSNQPSDKQAAPKGTRRRKRRRSRAKSLPRKSSRDSKTDEI